jgi:hypothetical protein
LPVEDVPFLDEDSEDSFGFEIGLKNAKKLGQRQKKVNQHLN